MFAVLRTHTRSVLQMPFSSARAALTKYHRLSGLNSRTFFSPFFFFLTVLAPGSPKLGCQQAGFPLRAIRKGSVLSLSPWLAGGCPLAAFSRGRSVQSHPRCCFFGSNFLFFCNDTGQMGLEPTLIASCLIT